MRSMSAGVSGPFLTRSVVVSQLRIRASWRAGSAAPRRSSARNAVRNSFAASRGGSFSQRVIAR